MVGVGWNEAHGKVSRQDTETCTAGSGGVTHKFQSGAADAARPREGRQIGALELGLLPEASGSH